ncbi:MAG: OmpA family protein [Thermodesulfobacteriota bacterium]|nr:OmpA family protein [Thermodesulfobacteriota bacterium]
MKLKIFFMFLLIGFFPGCASRDNIIVLLPDPDGTVGSIKFTNQNGSTTLEETGQALYITDMQKLPSESTPITDGMVENIFAEAIVAQPQPPVRYILYFKFDSTKLTQEANALLLEALDTIHERGSMDIIVTGHTDKAGAKEYNLSLSLKRAQQVKDILISRDVATENIRTSSHGEGNPLIPTADNVPEPKNRRVEVIVR